MEKQSCLSPIIMKKYSSKEFTKSDFSDKNIFDIKNLSGCLHSCIIDMIQTGINIVNSHDNVTLRFHNELFTTKENIIYLRDMTINYDFEIKHMGYFGESTNLYLMKISPLHEELTVFGSRSLQSHFDVIKKIHTNLRER